MSTITYITFDHVDAAIDTVVAKKGDQYNKTSKYIDSQGNRCFAGEVLVACGLPTPQVFDGGNEAPFDSEVVQLFYWDRGYEFSPEAVELLRKYQDAADYGVKHNEQRRWSHAVLAPFDFNFQGSNPKVGSSAWYR